MSPAATPSAPPHRKAMSRGSAIRRRRSAPLKWPSSRATATWSTSTQRLTSILCETRRNLAGYWRPFDEAQSIRRRRKRVTLRAIDDEKGRRTKAGAHEAGGEEQVDAYSHADGRQCSDQGKN